jgi:hypothetical protein
MLEAHRVSPDGRPIRETPVLWEFQPNEAKILCFPHFHALFRRNQMSRGALS